ncbi:LacI family DNA-binding transcriptional regulator [Pseudarthrobacter sp. 1C304]|uniref:LacI family DNA-binding transcriptional regulator n=1 Tax=Pseudarthrobacter sp. 1C304 TaxID=3457438 RepID=UPI003FCEF73E
MPGERNPGIARVAAAAGVSVGTVSNVMHRPEIVAPSTRERVLKAIEALDFVPNTAGATLRQGANRLLGLVVPQILNPFYAAITESIATAAGRRGYALALCVSHDDPEVELAHFEMIAQQRAAGAIVVPLSANEDRLHRLRTVGTRLVLIDRTADEREGCSVVIDDFHGGSIAAEHLLAAGSAQVLHLVNGPLSIPQCRERREGTLSVTSARDIPLEEHTVAEMSIEEGFRIAKHLAGDPRGLPMLVFCTNDQLATGVIRGLEAEGLRVPDDALVVGYGDLELATTASVPLTSVAQPKAEMGSRALSLLLEELDDSSNHQHRSVVLQPKLVIRESAP